MKKKQNPPNLIIVKVIQDDDISYEDLEELLDGIRFIRANNSRGCNKHCWVRGNDSTVYTRTEVNGRLRQAHRVSYEIFSGTKIVNYGCHKCDRPACISPDHIYDGENWQNTRDTREEKVARNNKIEHPKLIDPRTLRKLRRAYKQSIIDKARIRSEMSRNPNLAKDELDSLISRMRKLTGE